MLAILTVLVDQNVFSTQTVLVTRAVLAIAVSILVQEHVD
jgi:hypothetical protein